MVVLGLSAKLACKLATMSNNVAIIKIAGIMFLKLLFFFAIFSPPKN
jgi:hypothetical protein